jgi:large subunit ribosomal protein L21
MATAIVVEATMYAIVRTGGKQYRAEPGALLTVERLDAEDGASVELADVLMIADGDRVTVGAPTVPGAKVIAEVVSHGRAKKVVVFKYKPKVRYRKKTGHRQPFTQLRVKEIVAG